MKVQIFVAVAALTALAACNSEKAAEVPVAQEAEQRDEALIRVIHAMPQAPEADVYTGEHKAFSNVRFGTATSYKAVPEKEFTLSMKPAGQPSGPLLFEAKEGVEAGRLYTIVALPDRDGAAKVEVLTDDLKAPSPGKAVVRVFHADPKAGEVKLFAATQPDEPVIDGVEYGSPARYQEVDPADMTLRVELKSGAPQTSKTQEATVAQKTTLEAGKAYTLVVTPAENPGELVRLIKVDDTQAVQAADRGRAERTGKVPAIQREDVGDERYEIKPDVEAERNNPRP